LQRVHDLLEKKMNIGDEVDIDDELFSDELFEN
jgi:hypothetical protein